MSLVSKIKNMCCWNEDEDDVGAPSSKNHVELLKDVIKPLSKLKVDAGNHDP